MKRQYPPTLMRELADRRTELGMSQPALARRLGVSVGLISHWENGYVRPPIDRVIAYADALGLRLTLVSVKENVHA
ncbi:helix-turn-helix domain-containing protein [Nonomuraea sp. NPDC049655]|uniref:helix-turn-helix domain-containing protein n=1 Tax=Nonomuraea sp. NPDC049655 TaxID=3364355 RepID=UPI0037966CF3